MTRIDFAPFPTSNFQLPTSQLDSEPWRLLRFDADSAAEQMAFDEALAREGRPTVRLFAWRTPAISLGLRQARPAWLTAAACAEHGVEVVERPTGGAVAVHGSDLSCAVVAPHGLGFGLRPLMAAVCETIAEGLRQVGAAVAWHDAGDSTRLEYCLAQDSPYALRIGARKLGGFAVRRFAAGWLVQGSWLVGPMPEAIRRVMPTGVAAMYDAKASNLREAAGRAVTIDEVSESVLEAWRTAWGVHTPGVSTWSEHAV